MTGMPREEGFWAIVGRTLAEAPARNRWGVGLLLGSFGVACGLQLWDISGRSGPLVWAELSSVVLGSGGAVLVGLAYVLHGTTQKAAGCAPGGLAFKTHVPHQMLLALPVLGVTAGLLLGASVGLLGLRALHGRPILLLPAAMYLGIFGLAARSITGTTRFLYRHAREQAEAAARAESEAGEARLAALQAQMNPHFLFNALNTVASLVHTSPEVAEATVENLAGVLRRTLDRSRRTLATVGEEIDYLEAYLAVEQERWGERLTVIWRLAPETRELALPPMTLQPLVENALRHGLGHRLEGGTLTIGAELTDGRLRLSVTDDGPGFPRGATEGTGLGNLRKRLSTLYGDAAAVTLEPGAPGSRVVVELPVR